MFTVYVLYSADYDKIYIGFTSNLDQRMLSHNELSKKGWTVRYRPWIIIVQEQYPTKDEATRREKALKGGQGRTWIRQLLLKRN